MPEENNSLKNWASRDGEFKRQVSSFRETISETHPLFKPERNRYHLYVSSACPWAHRTMIMLHLKGLVDIISFSTVHYQFSESGWEFLPDQGYPDHLYGLKYMKEIYLKANENYSQRFTVPVLWDKKENTIVNNESSEIIRILNTAFNGLIEDPFKTIDVYPASLSAEIDALNSWIYDDINNGVYKSGFATTQESYEKNVKILFRGLNKIEKILSESETSFIFNILTEADIRLFTTIIRFDAVYVQHFKCNLGMIRHDYPYLHKWMCGFFYHKEIDAFRKTTNFEHITKHYTKSHPQINPFRITPLGPIPFIASESYVHEKPEKPGFINFDFK